MHLHSSKFIEIVITNVYKTESKSEEGLYLPHHVAAVQIHLPPYQLLLQCLQEHLWGEKEKGEFLDSEYYPL